MGKETFKNLAVLGAAILISFVIAELLMAVSGFSELRQDTTYRQSDDTFHHSLVPGETGSLKGTEFHTQYSINSLGFRDREFTTAKPEGTFRILVLGDSYTEGYGVEADETFSKQLEKSLNANSEKNYEVINTGVASFSPIIEYLTLKKKGLALNPDLVLLNFDWSDPMDDYRYSKFAVMEGDELVAINSEPDAPSTFFSEIRSFMSKKSRVYQFFARRFASTTSEIVPNDIESDRLFFTREITDEQAKEFFSNSEPYLLAISEELKEADIPFVIHIYPYGHQLSTEAWKTGRSVFFLETDKLYPLKSFDIVQSFGEENNIRVISSYSSFAEKENIEDLYFDYDGHFTPAGHLVAAKSIETSLKNLGLT
jgi:hypothetical protein